MANFQEFTNWEEEPNNILFFTRLGVKIACGVPVCIDRVFCKSSCISLWWSPRGLLISDVGPGRPWPQGNGGAKVAALT